MSLPAEVPWYYALNELVAVAIRDHGVTPVIRTIYKLFQDSRECFYFFPGLQVTDYSGSAAKQFCELDLVWIRDGEFGVAEVKRSPRKFRLNKALIDLLCCCRPDRLLISIPSSPTSQLSEIQNKARSHMTGVTKIETWGADDFGGRVGFREVTYSLFP